MAIPAAPAPEVSNDLHFIKLLANQFQRIDDTGQCDHGCSMLIIVENRDITAFL